MDLHPECVWGGREGLRRAEAVMTSFHWGQLVGMEEKHLRMFESETADIRQPEWSENHTDHLCCSPIYSRKDVSPPECTAAGS